MQKSGNRVQTEKAFCLIVCFLSSVFCLLTPAFAFDIKGLQPLPPYGVFSTFSAESLPRNKLGFGVVLEKSVEPDFYRATAQFAYGLRDTVELSATLPYVMEWRDSMDGFEDVNLGFKHRFVDEGKLSPAIAYVVNAAFATGKGDFSTNGKLGGGVVFTKKVGPFRGHLNAFYSSPKREDLKNEYSINIGTELAVTHNSKVLVEAVGRKNYFKSKIDLLEWRLGYRIATTDYLYTTVGAGFDFKNRNPDYRLLFSVSVVLPREKKKLQRMYEE